MTKQQKLEVHFRITNIEFVGFEMSLPPDFRPLERYQYDIDIESHIDHNNKLILVNLDIHIKNGKTKYGRLSSNYLYTIDNFDEVILKDKDQKYIVPTELQTSLNSISISTARGLMFSTLKGTALHNAILPVIDPKGFESNKL
ncbi:hypothetical protein [Pedobacter nutrimenti]|uniref:hypothetical protein n=1 Tax=Pedobacter nutrimenti TaxID=1241337 RepID=UPI002931327F|nr:hypothetical protein [Pedobacter nutrimenti]